MRKKTIKFIIFNSFVALLSILPILIYCISIIRNYTTFDSFMTSFFPNVSNNFIYTMLCNVFTASGSVSIGVTLPLSVLSYLSYYVTIRLGILVIKTVDFLVDFCLDFIGGKYES